MNGEGTGPNGTAPPRHPVLEEMRHRLDGERDPGHRLGLCIEGGGMRGVVSAGMLQAMNDLGLHAELFDGIYGASAGALNGLYFAAGMANTGIQSYTAQARDHRLKSPIHLLQRKPILDLDYLIAEIVLPPLGDKLQSLLRNNQLHILASDIRTGTAVAFPPPRSVEQLRAYLTASASIPLIAGGPKKVDSAFYLDASLTEGIPLETPIADGYTHLLVLSTRQIGLTAPRTLPRRTIDKLAARTYAPTLARAVEARRSSRPLRAQTLLRATLNPDKEPYLFAVGPSSDRDLVSQLTTDKDALYQAGRLGYKALTDAWGVDPASSPNRGG